MAERIRLTKNDFDHLARGGELQTPGGTHIIMADIGFNNAIKLVTEAPEKSSRLGMIRELTRDGGRDELLERCASDGPHKTAAELNEEPRRSGVRENTHAENMAEFNRAIDGSE